MTLESQKLRRKMAGGKIRAVYTRLRHLGPPGLTKQTLGANTTVVLLMTRTVDWIKHSWAA